MLISSSPDFDMLSTLPPETSAVVFFYSGGVNFLMQLQFLAPVELFFKQLNGYSF